MTSLTRMEAIPIATATTDSTKIRAKAILPNQKTADGYHENIRTPAQMFL